MSCLLRTEVLPAALRTQAELADVVGATQVAGVECPDSEAELRLIVGLVSELRTAVDEIDAALAKGGKDPEKHAKGLRTSLVPAMARARTASDALERRIPAELWPLPTYAEMLLVSR